MQNMSFSYCTIQTVSRTEAFANRAYIYINAHLLCTVPLKNIFLLLMKNHSDFERVIFVFISIFCNYNCCIGAKETEFPSCLKSINQKPWLSLLCIVLFLLLYFYPDCCLRKTACLLKPSLLYNHSKFASDHWLGPLRSLFVKPDIIERLKL